MEWTEEQNEVIGEKFEGLMDATYKLIDELYKKDEKTYTEGEQKFFDAFHEYMCAFGDDEDEDDLDDELE